MTDETMAALDEGHTEERPEVAEGAGLAGFLARLRARFAGTSAAHEYTTERLVALARAVERHPEAAANYVLRGELFLKLGERARAASDFQDALILTEAQFEQNEWGLVAQAVQERALAGLRTLGRRED